MGKLSVDVHIMAVDGEVNVLDVVGVASIPS